MIDFTCVRPPVHVAVRGPSTTSADGPYASSVVTVWDDSWSLNGTDQGAFRRGVVSPASNFDLSVIELQSVVTNG